MSKKIQDRDFSGKSWLVEEVVEDLQEKIGALLPFQARSA